MKNMSRVNAATEAKQKQTFLTEYVNTQDIRVAAKLAGINEATGYRWAKKFGNVVEAQFEQLGLTRDDVIKKHMAVIQNIPQKVKISKTGVAHYEDDTGSHLKAIEMFYEVAGIKKVQPEVVVVNEIKNETVIETEIFKSIPEDIKKEIRAKMIKLKNSEGEAK